MPYGTPPEGPKSGCSSREAPPMLPSQAALLGCTGRLEMSVFQTLLAGKAGQLPTPGAASTWTPASTPYAIATRAMATAGASARLCADPTTITPASSSLLPPGRLLIAHDQLTAA